MLEPCPDCGAVYALADESCQTRFDLLLALDHSHQEPWGSRHAVAFAVFALQHASRYSEATRVFALELLRRVFERDEPLAAVVAELRARAISPRTAVSPNDVPELRGPFDVTIATLGDFAAERYSAEVVAWARATMERVIGSTANAFARH